MVVELKKTKITKSIVDQSLLGNYNLYYNWDNYNILGWCLMRKSKHSYRYVLLYNNLSKSIVKLKYILKDSHVELSKNRVKKAIIEGRYIYPELTSIKIYFIDFSDSQFIFQQTDESEDIISLFNKVKEFIAEVELKGQIYL